MMNMLDGVVRPVQPWVSDLLSRKVPDLTEEDRKSLKSLGDYYLIAEAWYRINDNLKELLVWTGNERQAGRILKNSEGLYRIQIHNWEGKDWHRSVERAVDTLVWDRLEGTRRYGR